jgi:hypothetical protein
MGSNSCISPNEIVLLAPRTTPIYYKQLYNTDHSITQVSITFLQELLTSTSKTLYRITKRKARFHDVNIILPTSWAGTDCLNDRQINDKINSGLKESSDFTVTSSHPIFGDSQPLAIQYGQCGESGLGIRIPFGLLTQNLTEFTSKFFGGRLYKHNSSVLACLMIRAASFPQKQHKTPFALAWLWHDAGSHT